MPKVYQCIHKYSPHIAYFEEKYKPVQNNLSFNEWRNLLIADGFASCNILKPAIDGNPEEVFYTIWNYDALQYKWAEENGLKTKNLEEIKLAQLEEFKPDVFYNFSPNCDYNFIEKIRHKKEMTKVCWDANIQDNPPFHKNYQLRFTLFEPYVKFWKQHDLNSYLLAPAFPASWDNLTQDQKDIDILFYGQYIDYLFSGRNTILKELVNWSKQKGYNFNLHLQIQKKPLIDIRGFRRYTRWLSIAPKIIQNNALPPIYGQQLYQTIARSKIVINGSTNYNGQYKDNMRNYETTGCGAFLIGEDGIYPEHFIPNTDFYTYRSSKELFEKIEQVLSLPDQGMGMAQKTREKLKAVYSKNNQWNAFVNAINSL